MSCSSSFPSLLISNIEGTSLTEEDREFLQHPGLAGIILFARNYENRQQLARLINEIRLQRPGMLVCVDQEGGRVQRFQKGFTQLPPMAVLGELYQKDPAESLAVARRAGWVMAVELLAAEIDLSFAPVVDVDKDTSSIIGDRAFSENPQAVSQLSAAFIQGMQSAGMKSCAKHFPGHGGIAEDSHLASASDNRSWQTLFERDLLPYRSITNAYDAVMTAHIRYPEIDDQIASYSSIWINDILRKQLQFRGLVISDDLSMVGAGRVSSDVAEASPSARSEAALAAGCDLLISCNDRKASIEILESFQSSEALKARWSEKAQQTGDSIARILLAKRYHQLPELIASPIYKAAKQSVLDLAA